MPCCLLVETEAIRGCSSGFARVFKNGEPSPDTGGFGLATIKEQIEMIRAEIDKTQKNKATNAHIGKLKAKIAQLLSLIHI